MMLQAVLFDCDGVLSETERDGHRIANNQAFQALNINAHWSVDEYRELVRVSGGKERLRYYFSKYPDKFPPKYLDDAYISLIYREKTNQFLSLVSNGHLNLRPGVARLLKELKEHHIFVAVCSTSHESNVRALLEKNLGSDYESYVNAFCCGDIVPRKKPAPDIYLHCLNTYHLNPHKTVAIEDSENGLVAATTAKLNCLITQSVYTTEENFQGAALILDNLGDYNAPATQLTSSADIPLPHNMVTVHLLDAIISKNEEELS